MIHALDDVFVTILDRLKSVFIPIIIIVLVLTSIKIFIDYKKYGKKVFSSFKKREDINIFKKTLEISIKSLNSYFRIIDIDKNTFILILESGIYVINLCDYQGMITGNIKDDKLTLKANTENEEKLDNPVFVVKKHIEKLNTQINSDISGYVLLKKGCLFSVLNRTDIKVIPSTAFYYHFSKLVSAKIYSKEQVDDLYEKIV